MLNSMIGLTMMTSLAATSTTVTTELCLTEVEGTAVFAAMLPDLIDGLRDKCASQLPANSYLAVNGDALVARYKVVADDRWPTAKLAFARIAGGKDMADKLPDEFFRPMLGVMIGAELVKDIKPADCGGVDRVVQNLSPLPAENVAALIGAILMLASDSKDKNDSLPMCKA